MWCDIFNLFVEWNQKRKPVMEGNCRLNINIKGHIAHIYFLIRFLKEHAAFPTNSYLTT